LKQQLKKITNLTINDLLNNDIILPSNYFDKFNYHAKALEIDLDDENFKQELNNLITEDFHAIENYMNLIMSSAASLSENSEKSLNAILNKDINTLTDVYKRMLLLEKEIKNLNNKLFLDDITNSFNKKWIYNKLLNTNALFQQDGICLLVDVIDYTYIQNEYGELLANNLLIFASKFISQKLESENLDFNIVRYSENKFLIFLTDVEKHKKEVVDTILNLEQLLLNTTLKSNSGLFIKAKYVFKLSPFKKAQESKEVFEKLLTQEKEE
jgi:GGDEF domain-containing protein